MNTTKEYRILHNNKFIAEGLRYGEYDYTTEENAMTFTNEVDLIKYVQDELKLNIANVRRHITVVITSTENQMLVNGSWVDINSVEQCNSCLKHFPHSHLTSGVVDKETGLEHYCETCVDDVEFIVENRILDEESGASK